MLTRLLQIKDLPSVIGCEPIKCFKKSFSQVVKGILLSLVHNPVKEIISLIIFYRQIAQQST